MKRKFNKRLSKYDAPLKIQFHKGFNDFRRGRVFNPFNLNTMQSREWERGFNSAYFLNLKKVKQREEIRTRS